MTNAPKESALDRAIRAYREDPSEKNHQLLLALQNAYVQALHLSEADSFINRTR